MIGLVQQRQSLITTEIVEVFEVKCGSKFGPPH